MKTEKKAMKTPMYLYSVTRKEVAPSAMASMRSAAFWTICVVLCVCVGGGGGGGGGKGRGDRSKKKRRRRRLRKKMGAFFLARSLEPTAAASGKGVVSVPPLLFLSSPSVFVSIPSLLSSTTKLDLSATPGQARSEAQKSHDPKTKKQSLVSSTGAPDVTPLMVD